MESNSFMMAIIRALNESKDEDERNEIRKKLEYSLQESDAKLTKYVTDHHKELKQIIQSFTHIYSTLESTLDLLNSSRLKLRNSKEMLELRLDDLKRLAEEVDRNNKILIYIEQEEAVSEKQVEPIVDEVDNQIQIDCQQNITEPQQSSKLFSFLKSSHALCINEHYSSMK